MFRTRLHEERTIVELKVKTEPTSINLKHYAHPQGPKETKQHSPENK